MTEPAGNFPRNKNLKFTESGPVYDEIDEALLAISDKDEDLKRNFSGDDAISLKDQESGKSIQKTREVVVRIGKLHAIFWLLIVLSGIVWSFLFAAAIFTGFGSYQVSLFSVLATLALAVTVFSLSKDNVVIHTVKEDPEAATS